MINGNEYSWEDVSMVLQGKTSPIIGVTEIDYSATKEHFNIHGRGADPVAMGRGKKDYKGTLTLLQSELEALQKTVPTGKDITDLFGLALLVGYAPEEGGPAVYDAIQKVRFTEVKKNIKTGDGNMVCQLPFIASKIVFNV